MQLCDDIYFYQGSPSISENPRHGLYRGMGSSNFLILKGNPQIMIDSGFKFGPHRKRISQEMVADGINIGDTTQVIFSHAHPDHIQQAKYLSKVQKLTFSMHADNEVFTRNETFHFEAYFNYPKPIKREVQFLPTTLTRFAFKLLGFGFDYLKADHLFETGAIIDWETGIHTISLPGHCPGHVGFLFPNRSLIYGADMLFETDSDYPVLPCINNALSSLSHGMDDLEKISQLNLETFVPGHGKVINGVTAVKRVLEAARGNALRLIDDTLNILKTKPGQTLSELTQRLFSRANKSFYTFNIAIMYHVLIHLRSHHQVVSKSHGKYIIWQLS